MKRRETATAERSAANGGFMQDQVQTAGTSLATLEPPTDQEIERIRKRGVAAIAHRREIAKLEQQIAGLEWGSGTQVVKGASLSPVTRAVFAEFCALVRANPMYHVDMLGGRPYLNSSYWSDLINSRPDFHHYEQRDLSPSVEKALRERAARHRQLAEQMHSEEGARRLAKALDLEEEADDVALARSQWSAPEWATVVVQTSIWKFIPATPLDAIRRGEIMDLQPFLVQVHECNWAGNKPKARTRDGREYEADPIGNADPAKTARTRSLRRAAVKSFSAWMEAYERQIQKAEDALEAEFEVIKTERIEQRASLPAAGEPQAARTGNGEPSAARTEGARDLPVEDHTSGTDGRSENPHKEPEQPAPFDPEEARKKFFATYREAITAGYVKGERHAWATAAGLPASTQEWTPDHHARAIEILEAPARKKLAEGCKVLGTTPEQFAEDVLGRPAAHLKELHELIAQLHARADAAEGPQARML